MNAKRFLRFFRHKPVKLTTEQLEELMVVEEKCKAETKAWHVYGEDIGKAFGILHETEAWKVHQDAMIEAKADLQKVLDA